MQKGQSLIEVLIGLATASVIIGAITVATITALNNTVFSKNQNLATQYAQQGMEVVRNLRDRNYSQFAELNGTYCLAKTCNAIDPTSNNPQDPCGPRSIVCDQNVGGENADIFVRQVFVDPNSSYCTDSTQQATQGIQATVSVSWFDAKCGAGQVFCHTVKLSTCLSQNGSVPIQ